MIVHAFMVVLREPKFDVEREARKYGVIKKMFIDPRHPTDVYIMYNDAESVRCASIAFENYYEIRMFKVLCEWNTTPSQNNNLMLDRNPQDSTRNQPANAGRTVAGDATAMLPASNYTCINLPGSKLYVPITKQPPKYYVVRKAKRCKNCGN